ncbi:hypothetical protein AVEN_115665-1 [Araneus ventricosus]|uniref:Uncharacterized protein n=1 Tax=Araneus ventricosus TaxID=182803 RepID=A0A4Y2UXL6_ARAVE|nr:hypothetical protein AVEN_115665-1 [Araneus ventricosus]
MAWWCSIFQPICRIFRYLITGRSTQTHRALRSLTEPTSTPPLSKREIPPAPISSRARDLRFHPSSRIFTFSISTFMARQSKWNAWTTGERDYANFRPRRSKSHGFFSLKTGLAEFA